MKRKLLIQIGLIISFVFILTGCKSTDRIAKSVNHESKANIFRPQDPQKPYPYNEEEIVYKNEKDDITLAGTLTTPYGKGPFPAVILIPGTQHFDRNETIMGHRPFLVLADFLTKHGIAVLRVDDRGVGGSTGNKSNTTIENLVCDILTGVEQLKKRKEINPNQIGLIGHSEGGAIAPLVASCSNEIAFIVLMAPGMTGEERLYFDIASVMKSERVSNKNISLIIEELKAAKKNINNSNDLKIELNKAFKHISLQRASKEKYIEVFSTPRYKSLLDFEPNLYLKKVKCPVLVLLGEKDIIIPNKNLEIIEDGLKNADNKDYSIIKLKNLNHLFQTAKTGSPSEFGTIEETISPKALETICNWIKEQTHEN